MPLDSPVTIPSRHSVVHSSSMILYVFYLSGFVAKILLPEGQAAAAGTPAAVIVEEEADVEPVRRALAGYDGSSSSRSTGVALRATSTAWTQPSWLPSNVYDDNANAAAAAVPSNASARPAAAAADSASSTYEAPPQSSIWRPSWKVLTWQSYLKSASGETDGSGSAGPSCSSGCM